MKTNVWSYINKIPDEWDEETKEWYRTFVKAYYFQNTKAMDKIDMPRQMRRNIYNAHRGVKRDVFNKSLVDYNIDVEEED